MYTRSCCPGVCGVFDGRVVADTCLRWASTASSREASSTESISAGRRGFVYIAICEHTPHYLILVAAAVVVEEEGATGALKSEERAASRGAHERHHGMAGEFQSTEMGRP